MCIPSEIVTNVKLHFLPQFIRAAVDLADCLVMMASDILITCAKILLSLLLFKIKIILLCFPFA